MESEGGGREGYDNSLYVLETLMLKESSVSSPSTPNLIGLERSFVGSN